jgi:UDP-N-acetyl-D-mannosaminuronic acid transferase (WecB/TagA/CpsF family)
MKKIIFKEINFLDFKEDQFNQIIKKKGLFVFPSGFGLPSIENDLRYYLSLKKADFVFFDSGFFVLLLKFFKKIKVNKFSGYKFLNLFFDYLKKNKRKSIFCIDPNLPYSKKNKSYLNMLGLKNIYNYLAPIYKTNKGLNDKKLLKKITKIKPNFIMINLGGGTQEVLGLYLKKNLKFKSSIICTGGAISFFTGDQAPINNFIDTFYLGWLIRLIFNPFIFFKRLMYALKLLPIVIKNKVKVYESDK